MWKLKRALYGLRNAPRLWQDHFASAMERNNFQRMKSDLNLYVHKAKGLYVLAYVDDLMFFGCKPDVDDLISILRKELILKVTGERTEGSQVTFLGRNIRRTGDFIELSMSESYVENIVKELDLLNAKPALTPGTDTLKTKGVSEPLSKDERKRYRRLVGQLLWLCNVRCDIMFAVKELSRGLSAPTTDHWARPRHLGRYLLGTKRFTQHLAPTVRLHDKRRSLDINTYVDSDWAGCRDTRRSTSGVALFVLGVNLLSHSRTQATVALSSGEAELDAIGAGASDALFVRSLVLESRLFEKANLTVHTDSSAGKSMAGRFGTSRKTKHVELRRLCMQELVQLCESGFGKNGEPQHPK